MSVPLHPIFDRYAQVTNGLVAIGYGPAVKPNYLALVTGFLYGDNWIYCSDAPSTSWTTCGATAVTTWTQAFSTPTTSWTLVIGGI